MIMTLRERIQRHEGTGPMRAGRFYPYTDSVGKLSIGYGRNLTDKGLSRAVVEQNLDEDLEEAVAGASAYPWFSRLDEVRQDVVIEMVFNLGAAKFAKFKATQAAIAAGDYHTASHQMLASRWSRQVGQRARTLARMMKEGQV